MSLPFECASNAAVQPPRDHVSSAAHVHNANDELAPRPRRRITVRCNCLLAGTARSPQFGRYCPPFVISPAPADLQIFRRVALAPKPQTSNELDRTSVSGLNISFETMEAILPKRQADYFGQPRAHVPASVVWNQRIVSKVRGTECASHNFTNISDTSQLSFSVGYQKGHARFVFGAIHECFVLRTRRRRIRPRDMQPATTCDSCEEFASSEHRRLFEPRAHDCCSLGHSRLDAVRAAG